jgi:hypothetical protein
MELTPEDKLRACYACENASGGGVWDQASKGFPKCDPPVRLENIAYFTRFCVGKKRG